ncbi:hypothetical protein GCM10023152_09430 [Agromyces bauzanensis]|uniref:Uncharacterized protein n=1 Tax=Agromyces bauzanensis TaxID=1308924 RepID=A0A917UT97_9MICO|nr:hypothetical protein GCM10011372_22400 [Agromyces bauzanensis]
MLSFLLVDGPVILDVLAAGQTAASSRMATTSSNRASTSLGLERGTKIVRTIDATDEVPVRFTPLSPPEPAAAVPFAGSPTILVDGVDAFPSEGSTAELACRVYPADGRLAGTPSVSDLRRVLAGRTPQSGAVAPPCGRPPARDLRAGCASARTPEGRVPHVP